MGAHLRSAQPMSRSIIALPLLVLALLFLPSASHIDATQYSGSQYFAPCGQTTVASKDVGVSSTVTSVFGIGLDPATCGHFLSPQDIPRQYDWQKLIYFTPSSWTVAKAADIPAGTQVG